MSVHKVGTYPKAVNFKCVPQEFFHKAGITKCMRFGSYIGRIAAIFE